MHSQGLRSYISSQSHEFLEINKIFIYCDRPQAALVPEANRRNKRIAKATTIAAIMQL